MPHQNRKPNAPGDLRRRFPFRSSDDRPQCAFRCLDDLDPIARPPAIEDVSFRRYGKASEIGILGMFDLEQMRHDLAIVGIEGIELRHDLGDRALGERWYPFGASSAAVHGETIGITKGI